MSLPDLTPDQFDAAIAAPGLTVVEFSAEWCAPCTHVAAALREIAPRLEGRVAFARIDVEAAPAVALAQNVRGLPTLIAYRAGQAVAQRAGSAPAFAIQKWVEDLLSNPTR